MAMQEAGQCAKTVCHFGAIFRQSFWRGAPLSADGRSIDAADCRLFKPDV